MALFVACLVARGAFCAESQWVYRGVTERLIYAPDAQGDRVPDFSGVGYQAGKTPIPGVAVAVTVNPIVGDDTANIQAAINQVAALPVGPDGFRGAVLLASGDYQVGGQLVIDTSGVVLRGVGAGQGGATLHATGTSTRDLIQISGAGSQSLTGSTRNMIDKVVPVGSRSFRVDSASGFAVGDTVRITRPSTPNWISDLGMDSIPPRSDGQPINQWEPGSIDLRFDRVITRIEGDRIFVDAPLTNAFELQYGGGQIKKYNWSGRIENVGVENLRAESDFASDTDEAHSWNFVSIESAQNVWVRDTVSAYFARSAVLSNPTAKWVTVENVENLDPKSQITGSRRYTFDLSGQLELVTNSQANQGRHDFVNNSTRPVGPHVFHNSVANNALDESGPHQRWATGTLFDNITVDGDQINARNRGNFGTGHGWAGANMVIWNSTADSFIVQNPPTAQNWLIGSTGAVIDDQTFGPQPEGYVDSHGERVGIESLYEAQLADAADVNDFHWTGQQGDWSDPAAWRENLAPASYTLDTRDYLVGDIDDFTFDGAGGVDNAFVDPAWAAYVQGTSALPLSGFDDATGNQNIAFTIEHQLDPGERVVHGSLALALKQAGGLTNTDFLRLFDDSPEHKLDFGAMGWDSELAGGGTFVGVVDLGPYAQELQSGSVNVQVNDDSAVDWALYTISVANPLMGAIARNVSIEGPGEAMVSSSVSAENLQLGGEGAGALGIAATGSITLTGAYSQSASGVLTVELPSSEAGNQAALQVAGDAGLDGELIVVLQEGFTPSIGEAFAVVAAEGQINGQFTSITLPELAPGLGWKSQYTLTSVTLDVVLEGDYNRDGVVDASDYTVWRDTLGSTSNLDADGDNSGLVDAADYGVWRSSYGNSAGDFASSAIHDASTAPEPKALVLLTLVACGLFSTRNTVTSPRGFKHGVLIR